MLKYNFFKKIVLFLFLFSISPTILFAQTDLTESQSSFSNYRSTFPHHEVYLGYGFPQSINTYFIYGITGLTVLTATAGQSEMKIKGPGTFNLGYNWYILDWLAIGGTFTGECVELIYKNNQESNTESETMFNSSIQGKITFQYGGRWVRGYHGASIGLLLFSGSDNEIIPTFAFNITLAGIKFGPEGAGFNGFIDCGFGTNSLINAGVSYSF